MPELANLSLVWVVPIFVAGAIVVAIAGARLARVADALADRTGLGEVVAGALFVGAATSLPGAITSVSTAAQGAPELAIGNALGGLTAQTAFIAIADLAYRRANLEHAAASVTGLAQGVLLAGLLTIVLLAETFPDIAVFGVHPASMLIVLVYGFGLRLLTKIKDEPMWKPVRTEETRVELTQPESGAGSTGALWRAFLLLAALTACSGYVIGEASMAIVDRTHLSATAVGTASTAVANSLPELMTAIAAVRIGAVSLAVGDIVGGKAFEVIFLRLADLSYQGSIYSAFSPANRATALMALLMTTVLLLGMLRRERLGIARIGFESAAVFLLYAVSVVLVWV